MLWNIYYKLLLVHLKEKLMDLMKLQQISEVDSSNVSTMSDPHSESTCSHTDGDTGTKETVKASIRLIHTSVSISPHL